MSEKTAKHLIKNYGERAFDVMKLTKENSDLKNLISENQLFLKAEICI